MAFKVKQENYDLPPSSDQKHILRLCGLPVPAKRIEAYLAIKRHAKTEAGKLKMREWKENKVAIRRRHAAAGSAS